MTEETRVLYNGDCPICSAEISHYENYTNAHSLPIKFDDLNSDELERWGVTEEQAAKRLHVLKEGIIYSGIPAFVILWLEMPRFRWLGRLVGLPIIRHFAIYVYDWILAPFLFALHKRRVQRSALSK